jgi:hypothetical protein
MDWSFGIITTGQNREIIDLQIKTIEALEIKNFEIILVGGTENYDGRVKHINFDEFEKVGWITRKKNLIAQSSMFENVVISHDYVGFDRDWSAGFEIFGNEWNLCMTKVTDYSDRRFYDWVAWDSKIFQKYQPVPYSLDDQVGSQFIPGGYWVAKTEFMLANPLNENLSWGQSEDIEWSLRVRNSGYRFNPFSKVRHLKKHRGYKYTQSIFRDGMQIKPRSEITNWM